MKKTATSFLLFCILTTQGCADSDILPAAKVTFHVIDDEGNSVPDATVCVGWKKVVMLGSFPDIQTDPHIGKTDANGLYTSSGRSMHFTNFYVEKESCYRSEGNYKFKKEKSNEWEPWNPTITIVFRPVGTPIAMYAKGYYELVLPVSEIGYDFIRGDFVAPHGQGEIADCILSVNKFEKGERGEEGWQVKYDSTITFPGDFNGIDPIPTEKLIFDSTFIWPRHAPAQGYEQKRHTSHYNNQIKTQPGNMRPTVSSVEAHIPDTRHLFFRIRSEKNPDGTFKSALYGKMPVPKSTGVFIPRNSDEKKYKLDMFSFYVNPTRNDLNMEFDAKRNRTLSYPHKETTPDGRWWIPKRPSGEYLVTQP